MLTPTILHLLPVDLERGAQRYARDLRDALERECQHHMIATLFRSSSHVLDADVSLAMRRGVARRVGYDPRVTRRLRDLLDEIAPSIVVAHGSEPLKYLVATRTSIPRVYYRIGISHLKRHAALHRAVHGRLVRSADVVVGVSSACVDEVVADFGVARASTVVIPNGRRPVDFPPKTYAEQPGPLRLAFVGHLTQTKRPEVFLDIVADLRMRGCVVAATVVGGGPLLREVAERAADLGVTVTGPTSRVAEILRESDVFVFTSMPTGEGMPGVMIEAGMVGLPSVVTDVPGARDVIVDGVTGFVVPADQPMEAVPLIESLADDADRRRGLGLAAQERCRTRFTLDASARAWAELLDSLLDNERRR